jgi:hypothetical protein
MFNSKHESEFSNSESQTFATEKVVIGEDRVSRLERFHEKQLIEERLLFLKEESIHKDDTDNYTKRVVFEGGSLGIYKPKSSSHVYCNENGDKNFHFQRERAGYLIDKYIGFDLVPPTVIRDVFGEQGSVQQYVENTQTYWNAEEEIYKQFPLEYQKLLMLDYITFNRDRNDSNLLVGEKQIHAIDNERTFEEEPPMDDSFNIPHPDVSPQRLLDQTVAQLLLDFQNDQSRKDALKMELESLLDKQTIEATFARIAILTKIIQNKEELPYFRFMGYLDKESKQRMPYSPKV